MLCPWCTFPHSSALQEGGEPFVFSGLIGGLCYRTERIVFLALLEGRGKGDQCLWYRGGRGCILCRQGWKRRSGIPSWNLELNPSIPPSISGDEGSFWLGGGGALYCCLSQQSRLRFLAFAKLTGLPGETESQGSQMAVALYELKQGILEGSKWVQDGRAFLRRPLFHKMTARLLTPR